MIKIKEAVFGVIEDDINESITHKIFEAFITILIIANVFSVVFESFRYGERFFFDFEVFSVVVFTIEYFLRIWTSELKYHSKSGIKSIMKFLISPMGIIDFVAIFPFYLENFFNLPFTPDTIIIRVLRLTRILRLLKLGRYLEAFRLIKRVIRQRINEIMVSVFLVLLLLLVSSTMMYEFEKAAQPDKFPNILAAFWWAIATLTTIGYGDIYPITNMGKFFSAVISLIGIGMVALPAGIISSGFIEEFRNSDKKEEKKEEKIKIPTNEHKYCHNCGIKLESEED